MSEPVNEFPCTSCGACCSYVSDVLANVDKIDEPDRTLVEEFPYKAKEDGSCEKLIDGKCSVYEDRPTLCNIRKRWEIYFSSTRSWGEHMLESKRGCDGLQKLNGMDESWKVVLEQ